MTGSLMPEEVIEAITSSSGNFAILNDVQDLENTVNENTAMMEFVNYARR